MAKKKLKTVLTFVQDETGSMFGIQDRTRSAFNEYFDTLKNEKKIGDVECRLFVNHNGRVEITRTISNHYTVGPRPVTKHYESIMKDLAKRYLSWDGRDSITLTYTYPGVVPQHIKDIINKETEAKRFSHLAFVCDVDRWQVNTTKAPPRELFDPILVGEKNGGLWVLGSFDPTPVETYLLREFTS